MVSQYTYDVFYREGNALSWYVALPGCQGCGLWRDVQVGYACPNHTHTDTQTHTHIHTHTHTHNLQKSSSSSTESLKNRLLSSLHVLTSRSRTHCYRRHVPTCNKLTQSLSCSKSNIMYSIFSSFNPWTQQRKKYIFPPISCT